MQANPVLIRCDGSHSLGLGHIVRSLAVAQEIRTISGLQATFLSSPDPVALELIRSIGFSVLPLPSFSSPEEYGTWIEKVGRALNVRLFILDVRDRLPLSALRELRRSGIIVATLDDPTERRLEADLAFYPPAPLVQKLSWQGFTGSLKTGWDYVILRDQFRACNYNPISSPLTVLVTMGGSDPAGLTFKALGGLSGVEGSFRVRVILGAAFDDPIRVTAQLRHLDLAGEVLHAVENMALAMQSSTLAIASFGGTAYELACVGVPQVILSLTPEHAQSAACFEKEGIAIHLGHHINVKALQITDAVQQLLTNATLRKTQSDRARALIDGRGAERIAQSMLRKAALI